MDYMDVSPKQTVSVATALIPFLEHDDVNRALMGANMQRQAVPLLRPQSPICGTGIERQVAIDSGQVAVSTVSGEVVASSARQIQIVDDQGEVHTFRLRKFVRSNAGTCINQTANCPQGRLCHRRTGYRRWFIDRRWRACAWAKHTRCFYELGGWQLRRCHSYQRTHRA